jgi:hypothetical protein
VLNSIPSSVPADHEPELPADPYHAFTGEENIPFLGPLTVRPLGEETTEEPIHGAGTEECDACRASDEDYVWVAERWRVRATQRPTGLPLVLALESRPHLDLGDLPNLLAAELGVMTVRLEKAIRSLPGVAHVHLQRWGDGESHLRFWFLARPEGRRELRGPYLPMWDRALPPTPEAEWRNHLGTVAVWLAEFGGRAVVDPPRLDWQPLPSLTANEAPAGPAPEAADGPAVPTGEPA